MTMATQLQSENPPPTEPVYSPPPVLRLRLVPWDVACTTALLLTLVAAAIATDWYSSLFGFVKEFCADEDCGPVPLGVDFYIYPVVWGGLGAAVAAALLGPVVSLLRGWYMSFWPALAIAIVVISSVAGSALTDYSYPYWHWTAPMDTSDGSG
jgi:hypothetical protein